MDNVYPTDLADGRWSVIAPLIPPAKSGGRPRTAGRRLVLNTIFHLARAGCQWATLPKALAKRSTAHGSFARWKADGTRQAAQDALRRAIRTGLGREPEPSKAATDSQTVKGTEAGGGRGYGGGKKITGRKRHPVVDSLGLLPVVLVTAASPDDGTHAPKVLAELTAARTSRLAEVRGDSKYNNRARDEYLARSGAGYTVTVVERPAGATGFVPLPHRRVVERARAWVGKCRRNSKDYERATGSAEAMIQARMTHRVLHRLAPDAANAQAAFKYPRKTPQKQA